MLYGLALSYLYRTPPGGEAQGLGPAGLAVLGARGPFPAGPRTLLLYDAAKKPHASLSCGADGLTLLPPAPQSGYVTLQVGGAPADGGTPPTTWSLLLRDPASEWEPLAKAMAVARATSAAHGAASGGGCPRVVVQDVALGDGGPRADDVAALGDVCEVTYAMYAPPAGLAGASTDDAEASWSTPVESHTRALVALTAAQGPHAAPRGMLEGLTGCAAGGRRLVLVPGAAVCAGPELLAVSAHSQGLLMYDVTLHTARAVLPTTQSEEQAGAMAAQHRAGPPPPPPPPQPVTPVEDPRQALVQRMARLASQTGGQMPLPTLPLSRPQSPVGGGEWEEEGLTAVAAAATPYGGQPPLAAVAQQVRGDSMQEQLVNGHSAHNVHPAVVTTTQPPHQPQQQQPPPHPAGPPPHGYMPSTPTPMPVPQSGDSGLSHGHVGGQQGPSSSWGATPPSGMHQGAQQQAVHHEQQQQQQQLQQQQMSSPMMPGSMGGPSVGFWPGHAASPGLMYGAPVQHVSMPMPLAAQPPWALPPMYHHPGSPYAAGPPAMYYAAAQGDALARLHAVTEHLARSVDSMLHHRPLGAHYSPYHPPAGAAASLGTSSLMAPVSPALSTATTRVTRVAAERDAAEAQRRVLAAERDAAEDERDAALAQLVELRVHLTHSQEQVQALQQQASSAAEVAGHDVATTKAELAAAQRQAAQRVEELQAAVQGHQQAAQAWQQERDELEATCSSWERTALELQASCDALRRELAAEQQRRQETQQVGQRPAAAPAAVAIVPLPQAEAAAVVVAEESGIPQAAEVCVEEAPAAEATEQANAHAHIEEPVAAAVPAAEQAPSQAVSDGALASAPSDDTPAEAAAAVEDGQAAGISRPASPEPAWEDASETPTATTGAASVSDAAPEQEAVVVAAADADAGEPQPGDGAVASIPATGGPKPTQRPRGAGGRRPPSTAQPQAPPQQQVPAPSAGAAKPSRKKTIFDDSDDDGGDADAGAPPARPVMPPPPPRPAEPRVDEDDNDGW